MPLFQNYRAADRKRHLKRFGMFKDATDLSWIDAVALPGTAGPTVETPTGTIDGANTDFMISTAAYDGLNIYLNGALLALTVGYTLPTAQTIRFAAGYIPKASGTGGRTIDDVIEAHIWETA